MKRFFVLIGLLLLALPLTGAAAPDVRCWIDQPLYVGQAITFASPYQEQVDVYCRNKGDTSASAVTVTLTLPTGTSLAFGSNVANLGIIAAGNVIKNTTFNVNVTNSVVVGSKLKWLVGVTYTDGVNPMSPLSLLAISKVRKPSLTVPIATHAGMADYSPDGNFIVFEEMNSENLALYNVRNDNISWLTTDVWAYRDTAPEFSPGGGKILWQKETDSGNWAIFTMDIVTGETVAVLDASTSGEDWRGAEWTTDGRIVARYSLDNGIYIVNSDGTNLQRITPLGQDFRSTFDVRAGEILTAGDTGWSLGNMLVYKFTGGAAAGSVSAYGFAYPGRFRPGANSALFVDDMVSTNLFIQNLNGTGLKALTAISVKKEYQLSNSATQVTVDHPNVIAIRAVRRPGSTKNYWDATGVLPVWGQTVTLPIPLSGTTVALKTPVYVSYTYLPDFSNRDASWSKAGGSIVYTSEYDGYNSVWLMKPDGTGKVRMTYGQDVNAGVRRLPMISPNGTTILYSDDSGADPVLTLLKL